MDFITLKWMVFLLDIRITPVPLQRSWCVIVSLWFILSNQAWMECPNSWSSLFELDISKTNNFTENNFWYEDIIFVDTNTLFSVSFYRQRFEIIKIPVNVMVVTAAVPGPGEGQTHHTKPTTTTISSASTHLVFSVPKIMRFPYGTTDCPQQGIPQVVYWWLKIKINKSEVSFSEADADG